MKKLISSLAQKKLTKAHASLSTLGILLLFVLTVVSTFTFFKSQVIPDVQAASTDYYVSTSGSDTTNPGTQAAPFKTIQKAGSVVTPGSTVHVASGTYPETIITSINGAASSRIRFVSDTKWGAKIVPVAGAYTIWTANGGYTDIEGFQVDGTGSTTNRVGIYLTGGNSSVKYSWVHNVAQSSGCDSQGGAGLHADQYRGATFNNYDFIGNVVHDIGGGCSFIQGIYHSSSGTIKNNLVYATAYAIHLYHDDYNINVVNNTVFGNSGYGIVFGGCTEAYNHGCPTSGINIYNNIVYDNAGGISGPVAAEDVNNVLHNNSVFGNTNNFDLASPSNSTRTGEVNANPQFVNYIRIGGGDYHLKSTSPLIDKGTASLAPPTDLDGITRPQGAGFDIGAYEFAGGATPTPTATPTPSSTPTPCAPLYPSASTPPAGFGAAWNLFSTAKELLFGATCNGSNLNIAAGNAAALPYVYKTGYSWNGSSWQSYGFSGSVPVGDWFQDTAQAVIPKGSGTSYFIGYTCQLVSGVWKCGCSDTACAASKWQLQGVD